MTRLLKPTLYVALFLGGFVGVTAGAAIEDYVLLAAAAVVMTTGYVGAEYEVETR